MLDQGKPISTLAMVLPEAFRQNIIVWALKLRVQVNSKLIQYNIIYLIK